VAAPGNLTFEDAGARAGFAAEWFIRSKTSARVLCGFMQADGNTAFAAPNAFDDPVWSSPGGALNVFDDDAVAPDGTTTADRVSTSLLNEAKYLEEVLPRTFAAGETYTFGCYMKAATLNLGGLRLEDVSAAEVYLTKVSVSLAGSGPHATIVSPPGTNVDALSVETTLLPDGWVLASLSVHVLNTFLGHLAVAVYSGSTTLTEAFVGNLGGIYLWGAFSYRGEASEWEGYDWDDGYAYELVLNTTSVRALWEDGTVETKPYESFELLSGYITEIAGGVAAVFDEDLPVTPSVSETYEQAWLDNETYITSLDGVKTAATFNVAADSSEDYEAEWLGNEVYYTGISGVSAAFDDTAGLGSGEHLAETYEYVRADAQVEIVDDATDVFTITAHGWLNAEGLSFYIINPYDELPAPLIRTRIYYLRNVATDTFKICPAPLTAAIDITTPGAGEIWTRASPQQFWYEPDFNTSI
jgi:hypothetical protein